MRYFLLAICVLLVSCGGGGGGSGNEPLPAGWIPNLNGEWEGEYLWPTGTYTVNLLIDHNLTTGLLAGVWSSSNGAAGNILGTVGNIDGPFVEMNLIELGTNLNHWADAYGFEDISENYIEFDFSSYSSGSLVLTSEGWIQRQ